MIVYIVSDSQDVVEVFYNEESAEKFIQDFMKQYPREKMWYTEWTVQP